MWLYADGNRWKTIFLKKAGKQGNKGNFTAPPNKGRMVKTNAASKVAALRQMGTTEAVGLR